jgi:lysophospholipase L1-like esterase
MRRLSFWFLPLTAAIAAALMFGAGFYSFLRGDTGTPVTIVSPPSRIETSAPRAMVVPLVVGDSLARGTGDESGLGIGGRLVEELRQRKVPVKNAVNLAVNGARTRDLEQQLESANVRRLIAESNVVIVSIGGNDLWGDANNFRNAPPRDPEKVMGEVLERVTKSVRTIRNANQTARIFVIGLYNPFGSEPMGRMLSPFVNRWNASVVQRFAADPNVIVVQTSDLFAYRDRLSFDRFHPANEGYALIARRIADAL